MNEFANKIIKAVSNMHKSQTLEEAEKWTKAYWWGMIMFAMIAVAAVYAMDGNDFMAGFATGANLPLGWLFWSNLAVAIKMSRSRPTTKSLHDYGLEK